MLFQVPAPLLVSLLFLGILLSYILGLKLRQLRARKDISFRSAGLGAFEGALLGLLSLLLAFTFNQSATDFARHLDLLVAETDAIETAVWRADLYPDSLRRAFRSDFREYIAARIAYHDAGMNEEGIRAARHDAEVISSRIWQRAVRVSQQAGEALKSAQMIPAIGSVIDTETRREDARRRHVPDPILWLLFLLCVSGSFVVGHSNTSRKIDWVILCSYSLMTVMTVYIILDMDRPRRGIIETGTAHEHMLYLFNTLQNTAH
jgi:hypothetical protein